MKLKEYWLFTILKRNPKLTEEQLDWITSKTNRSKAQTIMLYQLVNYNFNKLVYLEQHIRNSLTCYCPGSRKQIRKVLKLPIQSNYFKL